MVRNGFMRSNKGDTIIEVTMAILVVGTILGGAYVAANRYFKNVRQAQEYSTALKIAEGQIEQIKSLAASSDNTPFSQTSPFCILNGGFQDASNASNCITTDNIAYKQKIERTSDDAAHRYDFVVTVSWENINGGSNSVLKLIYRMYN